MYQLLDDYDFVCGSRYKHGNKSEDDTFIRAIGNKIFTFITNHYLKLKISDSLFFYPLLKHRSEVLQLKHYRRVVVDMHLDYMMIQFIGLNQKNLKLSE